MSETFDLFVLGAGSSGITPTKADIPFTITKADCHVQPRPDSGRWQ
jgi:hypothetical protein